MSIEHDKAVHISAVLNKLKFTVERGALSLKDIAPIDKQYLVEYLQSYYLPLPLAKKYLTQLKVYNKNSKKYFYCLGFKNDQGGYEICNKIIQGYLDEQAPTFIRGRDPHSMAINVFKNAADFLSLAAASEGGRLHNDSLVLNALPLWKQTQLYIYNSRYKVVYSWLNNTDKDLFILNKLNEYFQSENIRHVRMNEKYADHQSYTTWRVYKLSQGQ